MLLGTAGESVPVREGELQLGTCSACSSSSWTASATGAGSSRSSATSNHSSNGYSRRSTQIDSGRSPMRIHHFGLAVIASRPRSQSWRFRQPRRLRPWRECPVHITNTSCVLGYKSVAHQYNEVVFGIFQQRHRRPRLRHLRKVQVRVDQAAPGKNARGELRSCGRYRYACVSAHSTVKKGVFTIR